MSKLAPASHGRGFFLEPVDEPVEEKAAGLYGHTDRNRLRFTKRLSPKALPRLKRADHRIRASGR